MNGGREDSPPHMVGVPAEPAARLVKAEHAHVAVLYPGARGRDVARPRGERARSPT